MALLSFSSAKKPAQATATTLQETAPLLVAAITAYCDHWVHEYEAHRPTLALFDAEKILDRDIQILTNVKDVAGRNDDNKTKIANLRTVSRPGFYAPKIDFWRDIQSILATGKPELPSTFEEVHAFLENEKQEAAARLATLRSEEMRFEKAARKQRIEEAMRAKRARVAVDLGLSIEAMEALAKSVEGKALERSS